MIHISFTMFYCMGHHFWLHICVYLIHRLIVFFVYWCTDQSQWLVMGDRLNFIIDHRLESVDAFDAILPIIISSLIFTEKSTFYAPEGNSGASGFFFLCPCVKGNNWFSYITLGKTYCQSSRRLSVSETSLPSGLVVHINLVIASFVQASDDRLLKMRINHHNQQPLRLINRLFPIIGTSLTVTIAFIEILDLLPSKYNVLCI